MPIENIITAVTAEILYVDLPGDKKVENHCSA